MGGGGEDRRHAALQLHLQVIQNNATAEWTASADPTAFLPDFHLGLTTNALWTLPVLTSLSIWGCSGAGLVPPAQNRWRWYVAQRMFSAKDEKNSGCDPVFNIAHYALRPWPWVVIQALAASSVPSATETWPACKL